MGLKPVAWFPLRLFVAPTIPCGCIVDGMPTEGQKCCPIDFGQAYLEPDPTSFSISFSYYSGPSLVKAHRISSPPVLKLLVVFMVRKTILHYSLIILFYSNSLVCPVDCVHVCTCVCVCVCVCYGHTHLLLL